MSREKLSKFLFSFTTEAVVEFVAEENFVDSKTVKGVSFWSPSSHSDFDDDYLEKIEEDVEVAELKVHKLLISARYFPTKDERGIMPKLAGRHEVMLCQFHQLLAYKQQAKDFASVIARSIDSDGTLTILNANWFNGHGWNISSDSVADADMFRAGTQVAFI